MFMSDLQTFILKKDIFCAKLLHKGFSQYLHNIYIYIFTNIIDRAGTADIVIYSICAFTSNKHNQKIVSEFR